jgi:replicative DNA helicase
MTTTAPDTELELNTQIHGYEAEAALIGAVLNGAAPPEFIRPEHFDWVCYAWAWAGIIRLQDTGLQIDAVTLGDEIQDMGKLPEFQTHTAQWTGRTALGRLRDYGQMESVQTYAYRVFDLSMKREIMSLMNTGASWALNGRKGPDIVRDLVTRLSNMSSPLGTHAAHIREALSAAWDYSTAAAHGEIVTVPTGFIDIDRLLDGGYSGGDLIILAGRPSTGKTALLATYAHNMTGPRARKKQKVLIFSLEMSSRQIAMRLIAQQTGITYGAQKQGTAIDWDVYNAGVEELGNRTIILCDTPAITVGNLRRELLVENGKGKVDIVLVDYLQLAEADDEYQRRDLEVAAVVRGLKAIAKEFDIPIVAAALLSRAVEQRADKRPILSDLGESSAIEAAADVVHFLYRDPDPAKGNVTEVITAKHRNGAVGEVDLFYHAALTKFEDAATRTADFQGWQP